MTLDESLFEAKQRKRWIARGTDPGELKATPVLPCSPVITGCRHNPDLISVRCKCMAGTWRSPSSRYFNYDRIAVVASLAEAKAAYARHLKEVGS